MNMLRTCSKLVNKHESSPSRQWKVRVSTKGSCINSYYAVAERSINYGRDLVQRPIRGLPKASGENACLWWIANGARETAEKVLGSCRLLTKWREAGRILGGGTGIFQYARKPRRGTIEFYMACTANNRKMQRKHATSYDRSHFMLMKAQKTRY